MTILIGANPIGWTNDDLQEIGGDTPLENASRKPGKRPRRDGEGPKMPTDGAALKDKLASYGWPSSPVVFDRIPQALGSRGIRRGQGAYRDDQGRGRRFVIVARRQRHSRRSLEPVVERPSLGKGDGLPTAPK